MGKKILSQKSIQKIKFLRMRGYSLPEIKRITSHSSGTVFKYIQGVNILPEFEEFWQSRRKPSKWKLEQEEKMAKQEARKNIKSINKKEKIIIAASLYWAEGAKRDLSISNSDPNLIKTFVRSLKEFGVDRDRLVVSVRVYDDLDIEKVCLFWSNVLDITRSEIRSVDILKGKKQGKLEYGMCRVRIKKGGRILKLLKALKNCIVENV